MKKIMKWAFKYRYSFYEIIAIAITVRLLICEEYLSAFIFFTAAFVVGALIESRYKINGR